VTDFILKIEVMINTVMICSQYPVSEADLQSIQQDGTSP